MKSIRRCEIVTNFKKGDDVLFDIENMKEVLRTKDCIKDFCYIIHNHDVYTEKDVAKNPAHKIGEPKAEHIHLAMRFLHPQKLECVAQWFGISTNFVNRIKGRWEDACLYQIHKNAPEKYQYSPDAVVCNFNYNEFLTKEENKMKSNDILERILNGEIREYNKTLEIDQMLLVTNARLINEAFKVRAEHLQATIKDRNTECIFITGGSGTGKTTLAKEIARRKELDFFISSGSNDILDGYCQEPCIILDDLRPSALGLSDLLKMLDNHSASSVKSRYRNKFLNCELIILTTVLDIDTFYSNVFSENDEPILQLKRRCGTYISMDKETINISIWDNKALKYTKPVAYKNKLLDKFIRETNKDACDVINHISDLIPFLELQEETTFEPLTDSEQLVLPFN